MLCYAMLCYTLLYSTMIYYKFVKLVAAPPGAAGSPSSPTTAGCSMVRRKRGLREEPTTTNNGSSSSSSSSSSNSNNFTNNKFTTPPFTPSVQDNNLDHNKCFRVCVDEIQPDLLRADKACEEVCNYVAYLAYASRTPPRLPIHGFGGDLCSLGRGHGFSFFSERRKRPPKGAMALPSQRACLQGAQPACRSTLQKRSPAHFYVDRMPCQI